MTNDKHGMMMHGLMTLSLVVLAVAAVWVVAMNEDSEEGSEENLKEEAIQAVFLSDGQVYFGDITEVEADELVLENIFYLQVDQDLQAGEEASEQAVSLAKLGATELHGPEDKMVINRDQVLFWENLKDDSSVVKAIKSYVPGTQNTPATNTNQ
jgi:hypothetical protein